MFLCNAYRQEGRTCTPLKGVTVFIAGTSDEFKEDWNSILTTAGALPVKKMSGVAG